MPIHTDFLPAERLALSEVYEQARVVAGNPILTAMLDTSQTMVALLNSQRQIVFCNDACARAGGKASKQDAVGLRPGELLNCFNANHTEGGCGTTEGCRYCALAQTLIAGQQGRANSGECVIQSHNRSGGIQVEYAVQVRPLPTLGARWQCFSLRDLTAEKRREALERIFFHDILNLAGAVEGVAGLLAAGEVSPEESDGLVAMLSTSASALVAEIRSQRTLLDAEKGDLAVDPQACDALSLLEDAAAACRSLGFFENKQLSISRPAGAQPLLFQTDPSLLNRILVNLLKNAMEASQPGGAVTAACSVPSPGRVRFSVHNETVMSDVVRAHIFQRSFSTKGAGRGIGTYSIRLLTEAYLHGRAWFESAPATGTTFYVEFGG
jgi:signal transduction histidine kinase